MWELLCFTDGEILPKPSCTNAQCVLDKMPPGSHYQIVAPDLEDHTWDAILVGDVNELGVDGMRDLEREATQYPILWCRVDSDAAQDDLTTYTQRLRFGWRQGLKRTAYSKVEVCVLWSPDVSQPLMPCVDRWKD